MRFVLITLLNSLAVLVFANSQCKQHRSPNPVYIRNHQEGGDCCWVCIGATPPVCEQTGADCMAYNECCSSTCSNGKCANAPPPACAPTGGTCEDNGDCCSSLCTSGTCESPLHLCKPSGTCSSNGQCCSNMCNSGVCVVVTV